MREIINGLGVVRRLTADEERDLARRRPGRDDREAWATWLRSDARRTLIECNIPWAMKITIRELRRRIYGFGAMSSWRAWRRLDTDGVGPAMVGLCVAVDGFDPDKGRMTTYAESVIRTEMRRASMEQESTIHVPEYLRIIAWSEAVGRPCYVRRPTAMGLMEDARRAMNVGQFGGRLRGSDDDGDVTSVDMLPDRGGGRDDREARELAAMAVLEAVADLPGDLAETVRLYHLGGGGEPSMKEVGARLGVSRQAVQARLKVAYRRLRQALAAPAGMTA